MSTFLCTDTLEEAGMPAAWEGRSHFEQSDFHYLFSMSKIERDWSVPHHMQVCYDSDRIHGVGLSLKMFKSDFDNEEQVILDADAEKYMDYVDELIEQTPVR